MEFSHDMTRDSVLKCRVSLERLRHGIRRYCIKYIGLLSL